MRIGKQKIRLATKMWMVPGEDQTVDELVKKYKDRVLAVEEGRILVVDVQEDVDGI